jgi:hypothetical protein
MINLDTQHAPESGTEKPGRTTFSQTENVVRPGFSESRKRRVRPTLWVALALSVAVHALWSLWPAESPAAPEVAVLTATLKEMPPPPPPTAAKPPPPKPVIAHRAPPARRTPTIESRAPSSVSTPPAAEGQTTDAQGNAPSAAPEASAAPGPSSPAAQVAEGPIIAPIALPPRVDLVYKVCLGTQGFMIGEATYRFEHDGDRYRISTVGQAQGLAALFIHGTGRVESRGIITAAGLKPLEFVIERGSADRRETAHFDWDARTVALNDGKTADLTAPAFDPLTIMWQPYFSPPTGERKLTFSLATTRKVARYTLSREADETLAWPQGQIRTERWHRQGDDARTEAWFWLAPSLHYIPVRMRVTQTARGTLEARLDSIRVDQSYAGFSEDPAGPSPPPPPVAQPRSPFNDMTGS